MRRAPVSPESGPLSLVAVEPGQDGAGLGGRLGWSRRKPAVGSPWYFYQCRRYAAKLKRGVILLGIADRRPIVLAADHHEGRSRDITHQRQRRVLPVGLRILPRQLAEPVFGDIG